MFKKSEEITKGIGSAVLSLRGQHLCLDDPINNRLMVIDNPVVLLDLLTIAELKRYVGLSELSDSMRLEVEETVVRDKVIEVVGYTGRFINIYESPAGVISTIANTIFYKSYEYLKEPKLQYGLHLDNVNFIEQMCGIVSYYLHMPFNEVERLPINEIFRLHSICHSAFPAQVNDIRQEEEE